MSDNNYPADEFDELAKEMPTGTHRVPKSRAGALIPFVAILVCVPLLAWAAVWSITSGPFSNSKVATKVTSVASPTKASSAPTKTAAPATPGPMPSISAPTPSPSAVNVDKAIKISVFNNGGRAGQGAAAGASNKLTEAGFTRTSAENGSDPATTSVVYYGKDSTKATAEAVAKALGISGVEQVTQMRNPDAILVYLNSDYVR